MLTITITDTNTDRYTFTASAHVLGRRYDNIAEYITVVKPESESGRDCIMIVTYGDTVVDPITPDPCYLKYRRIWYENKKNY